MVLAYQSIEIRKRNQSKKCNNTTNLSLMLLMLLVRQFLSEIHFLFTTCISLFEQLQMFVKTQDSNKIMNEIDICVYLCQNNGI